MELSPDFAVPLSAIFKKILDVFLFYPAWNFTVLVSTAFIAVFQQQKTFRNSGYGTCPAPNGKQSKQLANW